MIHRAKWGHTIEKSVPCRSIINHDLPCKLLMKVYCWRKEELNLKDRLSNKDGACQDNCLMRTSTFIPKEEYTAYLNIYIINTFDKNSSLCDSYMCVIQLTPYMCIWCILECIIMLHNGVYNKQVPNLFFLEDSLNYAKQLDVVSVKLSSDPHCLRFFTNEYYTLHVARY